MGGRYLESSKCWRGPGGIVDSKLDMGFHCVRPTEIGNAILHCILHSPLEQLGGERLFCQPRSGPLAPHMHSWRMSLLGLGCGRGHLIASRSLPHRAGDICLSLSSTLILCPWRSVLCPVTHHLVDVFSGQRRTVLQRKSLWFEGKTRCHCSFSCNPNICHLSWWSGLFSPIPQPYSPHEGFYQNVACLQTEGCLRKHKYLPSAAIPTHESY